MVGLLPEFGAELGGCREVCLEVEDRVFYDLYAVWRGVR
jgi:hypothetical protein